MTDFDVRTVDLDKLNSMTKYPSIPTYHALDKSNGNLSQPVVTFTGPVLGTEKIDGTNGRIVFLPDGCYLIGSREEWLYAKGDLIGNPALGIVDALRPIADRINVVRLDGTQPTSISVYYVEVYGGSIGQSSRQYTSDKSVGVRLFDVAEIRDHGEILEWSRERIAGWRDAGGQKFYHEKDLQGVVANGSLKLAPLLFTIDSNELPVTLEYTLDFLNYFAPWTRAALDDSRGKAEGIVLRSPDRSVIAKARFQDYERTLKRQGRNP